MYNYFYVTKFQDTKVIWKIFLSKHHSRLNLWNQIKYHDKTSGKAYIIIWLDNVLLQCINYKIRCEWYAFRGFLIERIHWSLKNKFCDNEDYSPVPVAAWALNSWFWTVSSAACFILLTWLVFIPSELARMLLLESMTWCATTASCSGWSTLN